jgi:hypothetical protein
MKIRLSYVNSKYIFDQIKNRLDTELMYKTQNERTNLMEIEEFI